QALILKKELRFKEMFDSLYLLLPKKPGYFSFYENLVFAANATGRLSLLESEANPLLSGLINAARGEYEKAKDEYLKALEKDQSDYNILYQLSYMYRNTGDYEKSLNELNDAVSMAKGDERFLIKAAIAEGSLNYLSGNYLRAEKLYEKAIAASRKIYDRQNEIVSVINLGILYDLEGDVEKARKYFNDGLNLAQKIKDIDLEAFAYSELGVSYTFTNDIIIAKENYLKSFSIYKEINDRLRLSLLSENIGKIYTYLFDYESAIKYYEQGAEYAGENKRARAVNIMGMADVYSNLSNYSKAIRLYREAQEISSRINELSLSSQISNGLGSLNFNLNRYNSSLQYFSKAAEINKSSGDTYSTADINYKTGLTYLMMDSLEAALKYLLSAEELSSQSGDYYTNALTLANLASLELERKDYAGALSFLKKAKAIAEKNELTYLLAECSIIEGEINKKLNSFRGARDNFLRALHLAEEVNEFNARIEAYRQLGELFNENNLPEAAESYYNSAIALVEDVSHPLFNEQDVQISYFSGKSDIYSSLADFYIKHKRYKEAFETIDKSRSRNTIQNISNLKLKSIIKDEKIISRLYEYEWVIHSGIYDDAKTDSVKRLSSLLKNDIISAHPEAAQYLNYKKTLTVEEIRASLKQKENFVLIYSGDESTCLFHITKNSFTPIELSISRKIISEYISDISPYYSINQDIGNTFYNQDLFSFNSEASNKLYLALFKDLFLTIPKNEKIIIAPSSELLILPVELLVVDYNKTDSPYKYSDKDFLINHYSISYSPSAAAYVHQRNNKLVNEDKIVIIGDPAINTELKGFAERRSLLEESPGIPRNIALLPLKYSGDEVSQVEDITNADKVFTSSRATETNFKLNAGLSKIIHLSTHSFLYNKQPVIFFSNIYDAENDGFLEAGEIVQMQLNSDLVVLSSCNSGLGALDNSEGILGMTKAFFEAGAKSIVVSLWEVNDRYTAKFMGLFYSNLSKGLDKSEALRRAKLDFIKQYSSNPYYWGAFVLSGNISNIPMKSSVSVMPYLAGLIVIICIALGMVYLRSRKNHRE
ncbi:MAG: CHAT domain-containing protein, partial [Ignavibacteriaceae bacterium]